MPTDLVDTRRDELEENGDLSGRLEFGSDKALVSVLDPTKVAVFEINSIVLQDHFSQIKATVLTSCENFKGIMGLGDRVVDDLFLGDGVYSLWSRDVASPTEDGKAPGKNMYGSHPFFMAKASTGTWFGVYTNLAAAQDWSIKNDAETGRVSIEINAAGGLGDLYFLFGRTPDEVSAAYQSAITGSPVLVPQWALGWHQCKWGYENDTEVQASIDNYKKY